MITSANRDLSQECDTNRLEPVLKPYERYASKHGIPWLPPIPAHWNIVSNRIAFQETDETNHPNEIMLSVTIGRGVILQSDLSEDPEADARQPSDRSQHKLVEPDDIVYNKMRAWQGAIGASEYRGLISPDYVVEKPRMGVNAKYIGYLFRTPNFAAEARRWSYGIASDRWRLRHKDFKSIQICLPPPDEQAAIVRYLDHAADLINRYIGAKERLIALLEEQRQAVIHQLVTRGLDAAAPLKQSGTTSGDPIPAHWTVRKLGHLATKFGSGITPRGGSSVYRPEGIPFLRSQNIHFDGLHLQDVAKIPPDLHQALSASHVQPEDVLLNITGASIGRVCAVPNQFGAANVNQHVCIIRPNHQHLLPRYLSAYLARIHRRDAWGLATQGKRSVGDGTAVP